VGAARLPRGRARARGRRGRARRREPGAVAVLEVEETIEYDKEREAERCFRTTDEAHPGVARLYAQKPLYLAGKVTVFERASRRSRARARPADTRARFAERGWKRVVGFQTRNPIHRAHEYLTKGALETVDGLLIHPLVGETKSDDVPGRDARRVLPRPRRELLPGRPRARLRLPGRDALRGPARGDLARDLP
jgi:ATP sulfurylase